MPYTLNPVFKVDAADTKLWRYISLAKFVDLLRTETLFLSSLNALGSLDRKEGLYTEFERKYFERDFSELTTPEKTKLGIADAEAWDQYRKAILPQIDQAILSRRQFAACCWHANSSENYAMWRIYAVEHSGICIHTTIDRLTNALATHKSDDIYFGKVIYIDASSTGAGLENALSVAITKRREFSYENEYRMVVNRSKKIGHNSYDFTADTIGAGLRVEIDPGLLIEEVLISPFSDKYMVDAIQDIMDRYGLKRTIKPSTI